VYDWDEHHSLPLKRRGGVEEVWYRGSFRSGRQQGRRKDPGEA